MDVSQYLEIFIDETKEHLQTLSDQLMILEQEPGEHGDDQRDLPCGTLSEGNGGNDGLQAHAAPDS